MKKRYDARVVNFQLGYSSAPNSSASRIEIILLSLCQLGYSSAATSIAVKLSIIAACRLEQYSTRSHSNPATMSIPKGVRELRIEFERITSKRGDVAELRAAFDCINSKCETKAADERRTNSASPRMLSSPFDVREKSGSATPEQWQSPRQYWGAAVNNLAKHTFPSDGWYGRTSQHKVVSPRMLSSPFYVREACESTTFEQWPITTTVLGPAVNNPAQHIFPPDSRHSRTPQYKAKNSGGGSNSWTTFHQMRRPFGNGQRV